MHCSIVDRGVLTAFAHKNGLKMQELDGDNNCSFRLYCSILNWPQSEWRKMRVVLGDFIFAHRSTFERVVEG
jgi:hypothetical protein